MLPFAQIARIEKLHDAPQFKQAVFHRRAGQRNAEGLRGGALYRCPGMSGQPPNRLRLFGRRILDVLRLVQNQITPLLCLQHVDIPPRDAEAGNHHVILGQCGTKVLAT